MVLALLEITCAGGVITCTGGACAAKPPNPRRLLDENCGGDAVVGGSGGSGGDEIYKYEI